MSEKADKGEPSKLYILKCLSEVNFEFQVYVLLLLEKNYLEFYYAIRRPNSVLVKNPD